MVRVSNNHTNWKMHIDEVSYDRGLQHLESQFHCTCYLLIRHSVLAQKKPYLQFVEGVKLSFTEQSHCQTPGDASGHYSQRHNIIVAASL